MDMGACELAESSPAPAPQSARAPLAENFHARPTTHICSERQKVAPIRATLFTRRFSGFEQLVRARRSRALPHFLAVASRQKGLSDPRSTVIGRILVCQDRPAEFPGHDAHGVNAQTKKCFQCECTFCLLPASGRQVATWTDRRISNCDGWQKHRTDRPTRE
jgi:hypothetical protein